MARKRRGPSVAALVERYHRDADPWARARLNLNIARAGIDKIDAIRRGEQLKGRHAA